MKIRYFIILLFISLGCENKIQKHPNVVLIMMDDMNDYPEVFDGHPQAKTPNIKKSNNKIQYSDVNEVTIIIYPKKTNTGNVFFYDIKGNRVSKIPRGKRDLSMPGIIFKAFL